uniref:NADH-ubiquinone oxidoreductase chain 2 n=1 Tax=Nicrophorus nepalensis TaxID=307049 RepID=A0A8A5RBU8_NICNE|nr:NADH dehydrogenase subunit 2 [Nicrophorus nepalensis]QTG39878.1 NADH dehydrogenase subunit 2 [Nicrophorus nepalensis]
MMKYYNLLFSSTLIISTLISISSNSWMGMWLGLEINLLSIIPLMNSSKNPLSAEASIKYFSSQALASIILLFSIIFMSQNMNYLMILIFNSSLLTKLGSAPFHFWFPEVMEGLSWINCMIMLTWQKISPMVIISYNFNSNLFYFCIIVSNMLISGLMGINQVSLRKIMAYSSINHIGWMLSSLYFMDTIWSMYFLIYSTMTVMIVSIFWKMSFFYVKQLITFSKNKVSNKLFLSMNFLSLGGLPPFIGFLPKWATIQSIIMNQLYLMAFIMVISTLVTLYFYIKLMLNFLSINLKTLKFHAPIVQNMTFSLNFIFVSLISLLTLSINLF